MASDNKCVVYRLHIYFAGPVEGKMLLIVVDSTSKWPEVIVMSHTTTSATIEALQAIFARLGLPVDLIISDNGARFSREEASDVVPPVGQFEIGASVLARYFRPGRKWQHGVVTSGIGKLLYLI